MATATPEERTPVELFRQEKNALFEKGDHRLSRRRPAAVGSAQKSTAAEAAAIQQSLGRTQKLLHSELARVAAVEDAITGDERLLRETMHAHQTLDVAGAKTALTALARAEQSERRVLAASIFFFWSAVFYVVWCRILIRIPFLDRLVALLPMLAKLLVHWIALAQTKLTQLVYKY